jgi:hypothetical protein
VPSLDDEAPVPQTVGQLDHHYFDNLPCDLALALARLG